MVINSCCLLAAFLASTFALDVIEPFTCSNKYVYYYRTTENSGQVTCMDVPIENFCIPAEANDMESLELSLTNCSTQTTAWIPTGLFHQNNWIKKLVVYAQPSNDRYIKSLRRGTFENLDTLEEMTLEGFDWIRDLDSEVFRPLVRLRKLTLIGFGAQFLTYSQLGDALAGLSNSSLEEITMDQIHSKVNTEKVLNLNELFRISGVNITSLVLTNNDFNSVTGTLSMVLPSLKYLECSMYWLTFAAMNFAIDSLVFLEQVEEINFSVIASPPKHGPYYQFLSDEHSIRRRSNKEFLPNAGRAVLKYFSSLKKSPDCFYGKVFTLGPKLKRIVVRNMNIIFKQPDADICFEESTQIEYIDFLQSPLGTIPGTLRGFKKLKFFNLQETGITFTSDSFFHKMSNLEVLLLGRNNIGSSIAADDEGNLFKFQNRSLRSLDLSECRITRIPSSVFSALRALQFLNLSRNRIETFEMKLHHFENLSLLNLSDNSIRLLSPQMIDQLESLQDSDYNNERELKMDLSRNPLSCLCNNTDFVVWLKSTKKVSFENVEEYTCLHPNATQVSISRLNVTELLDDCEALTQLVNTTCPCEGFDYKRLRQISVSLTDVYCSYDDKRLSYADLVANTNKTLQEYWWCKSIITRENPLYKSPRFIGPVSLGFLLLLLLGIALVVIYKKRYTPADVARMMQCMDMRPYIMHFIHYLSMHPTNSSNQYEFDVFIYFQDDDGPWVRTVLLEKLERFSIITPDQFLIGASMTDAILDGCIKSRVVVLVLSSSFKRDDWCREVTLRAYTSHPGSVIPVVIKNIDLSDFDDDLLFANLIATHNPTDLSSADERIWYEFIARVDNTKARVENTKTRVYNMSHA